MMKKFKPLTWEKEPVLSKDLLHNLSSKELPQEFSKLVDENFDELIGEEPKQETLEDVAERGYTEEDLREAFKQSRQCKIFEKDMPPVYNKFEDWFEQFKKK